MLLLALLGLLLALGLLLFGSCLGCSIGFLPAFFLPGRLLLGLVLRILLLGLLGLFGLLLLSFGLFGLAALLCGLFLNGGSCFSGLVFRRGCSLLRPSGFLLRGSLGSIGSIFSSCCGGGFRGLFSSRSGFCGRRYLLCGRLGYPRTSLLGLG